MACTQTAYIKHPVYTILYTYVCSSFPVLCVGFHCDVMNFVLTGAGIYVTNSQLSYSSSSLPNNSIITSYTSYLSRSYRYKTYRRMGFYCCSNSTTSGSTGSFIGLNGNSYSGRFSVQRFSSSSRIAGCMFVYLDGSYYTQNYLSRSEEGIYTCRMPDSTGRNIDVSVGVYRRGYTSKSHIYSYWHNLLLVCCSLV